jgi:hypothetical protein
MRLTTNDKLVQQRSKWARYLTFAGMGLLLGSLVLSFTTDYIALAYATLLGGFVIAMVGSYLANKWIKPPRADLVLEKSLKGFDNKHHLYNYLLPAEHVLLTPSAVLVFKTKYHDGEITCKNGKWNRPWQWTRLFGAMAQEPLGDPLAELQLEMRKMQQLITQSLENGATIPVDGYVVFTDPRARLALDDPAAPVLSANELKDTLRKNKRTQVLPNPVVENLERVLNEHANAKTTK